MTKRQLLIWGFSVCIATIILMTAFFRTPSIFNAKIIYGDKGWGYEILANDSILIHQETIPAATGNRGFEKKYQAERAATLIINKLKHRSRPTVTTFELYQAGALTTTTADVDARKN